MRFLSYNIHGCVGRDGKQDADRVLDVIQQVDADVIALQEVDDDREGLVFISKLHQLGYGSILYGPTMRKPEGDYGNLLMTRSTADRVGRYEINVDGSEPRGIITASTQGDIGRVRIVATHLGLGIAERRMQWAKLLEQFKMEHDESCAVMMGDFNEWLPWGRSIRNAKAMASHVSALNTFPVGWPVFALDRIFVLGQAPRVKFYLPKSVEARTASDHRPLMADLQV